MDIIKQQTVKNKLPEGVVMLTRQEALTARMSLVLDWKPQSEVWPVVHGRGILSIAASLTGVYINSRFRRKLKLRNISQMPTVVVLAAAPALLTGLFHTQVIFDKLLLLETSCPLCLEFRGALIQSFFGLVVPVLATPLTNFAAVGSGAHNMPYIHEVKKVLTIVRSTYKPMIPNIALLFILQALFGGYMTHLQITSYLRILNIHYLIEQEKKTSRVYTKE